MAYPSPGIFLVSRLSVSACLLVVFFVMTTPASAQDASTAAIRGTVTDSAGARVNGASVVVVNTATGIRYSARTTIDGVYFFDLLPPRGLLGAR